MPTPQIQPQEGGPEDSFDITKVIYISRHTGVTASIEIYDLTDLVTAPYHSGEIPSQVEALVQKQLAAGESATWILRSNQAGKSSTPHPRPYLCTQLSGSPAGIVASWLPSAWNQGKNRISFLPSSPHSEHDIVMLRPSPLSRTHGFVKEGVQFLWRYDGISRRSLGLWAVIGGQESIAAQYKAPSPFADAGGALFVDTNKIDVVVAFLTCLAMLRT